MALRNFLYIHLIFFFNFRKKRLKKGRNLSLKWLRFLWTSRFFSRFYRQLHSTVCKAKSKEPPKKKSNQNYDFVLRRNAYTLSPFYIFDDPTYFEVDGVLKLEVVISDYIGRFCLSWWRRVICSTTLKERKNVSNDCVCS